MQSVQGHIQSIGRDAVGIPQGGNEALATPNGGVTVGPAVDWYALSQITSDVMFDGSFINMQRLEAICIATGMSPGAWQIYNGSGAAKSILQVLAQPVPSTPGTRYVWEFPTPLQTGSPGFGGFGFHVRPTASGMGTWFFFANGYKTQVEQGGDEF